MVRLQLEQLAQKSYGCPIPESIQNKTRLDGALSNLALLKVPLSMAEIMKLDDL